MPKQNPHVVLDNLSKTKVIKYTWNDRLIPSDSDSVSYQLQRIYTVFAGGKPIQLQYTLPIHYSAKNSAKAKIAHPHTAKQTHKAVVSQLLELTLKALQEVSNV